MANTYTSGTKSFDIDTSTAIDTSTIGLEAIKGSAVAAGDKIYVYNGATLTVNKSIACLIINVGNTSSGAAGAGNRYGLIVVNAGVTITWDGSSTQTNSGILMNPGSADASSKGCSIAINGTPSSRVVMTNAGNALATGQKWCIWHGYGNTLASCLDMNYTYSFPVYITQNSGACTFSSGSYNHNWDDITSTGQTQTSVSPLFINLANFAVDVPGRYTNLYLANPIGGTPAACFLVGPSGTSCNMAASNGEIICSGYIGTPGASTSQSTGPVYLWRSAYPIYTGTVRLNSADVRATMVIPTGLTFTDLQDGTIKVTISNIASYRTVATNGIEDYIQLYDASNNPRGGAGSKTRYVAVLDRKPANCFIIAGVPLSAMANWYAKATTDHTEYSQASAAASTITPTLKPIPADVRSGVGIGQLGADATGTRAVGAGVLGGFIIQGEIANGDN
jgi:hypothetical protein